ncbi:hypothetical protein ACQP2T_60985 [Nonomuraea sp. CA-143628]|uniref:hypothetical protein n=1 Tax=Nonomuraea sp. CA-143628 TaxID=3239997 RepID=UPI003D910DBF
MMTTTEVAILAGTAVVLAMIAGVVLISWRALGRCTPDAVPKVLAMLDQLARTMLQNRSRLSLLPEQEQGEMEGRK